ncbi:MAG: flagellar hook-basal body complex protein, partial [Candidatus Omnitrophica bacterium]|nr:flagellar hook-basal body complex protein [Candidatus Omnitrophota bacterium]
MLRSMFTGISGLRNHQVRMDVVANNIANINTTGFKRGRVNFQDILSQVVRGASPPTDTLGGTNPIQVGLGMSVASIDTIFTQGNLQLTGVNTDMAIQGNGMFILRDADGVIHYSRAGTFVLDANGNLVNVSNGYFVQGWQANSAGEINTSDLVSNISIPTGSTIPPNATTKITFSNNLDSRTTGKI